MTQIPPQPPLAPRPLSQSDERVWAILTHVSALVGIIVGAGSIGWLGPLIIFLVLRDRSAFVRQHAIATLNFQITLGIAIVVAYILVVVSLGLLFFLPIVVAVLNIVFSIIGAVAANRGEPYTYPLAIRFLR